MAKTKVLLSVCNTGWIHKFVTRAVVRCCLEPRYEVTYIDPTHRPYEHNLNRVVKDLLTVYRDYHFWLNMDADNPPLVNPLDLVQYNEDIIGLPTPVWHDAVEGDRPWYLNAVNEKDDGFTPAYGDGLTQVDAVGSGCMLVHRRVCETMLRPLFVREYNEDGSEVTRGPDYRFCQNARKVGFKVFAAFGHLCTHMVENDLLSQIKAFAAAGGG